MTVETQSNKAVYLCNGVTTAWPYNFPVTQLADMVVTLVNRSSGDETVIPSYQYSVTGIGTDAGGIVTYPLSGSPPSNTYSLVIERVVEFTQETELTNQGPYDPSVLEAALDKLTFETQQLKDGLNRALIFSVADEVGSTLPVATARANKVLGFDSNGDPTAVSEIDPSVMVSAAMIPVVTAPTTSAALLALGLPGNLLDLIIPAGTMWDYTLPTAPAGFVFPVGQACTALYPTYRDALIAAGSPYGNNGTDPLMPDRRGRLSYPKDNLGGVAAGRITTAGGGLDGATLGVGGGAQSRTLTRANLPNVNVTFSGLNTPVGVNTVVTNIAAGTLIAIQPTGGGATAYQMFVNGTATVAQRESQGTFTPTGNIVVDGAGANLGSSTAFFSLPPGLVCTVIMKVH